MGSADDAETPSVGRRPAPAARDTTRPDLEHLDADVAALGTPDYEITTVVDVAGHLPTRERAIVLHASQTAPFEGLPDQLRRAFLATDHLRRVVPP